MGLRELKKEQTRKHIADEAMRLFVLRGFDHVTVAEVAEASGVSEKTVFNYFPTKEDLFWDEVPEREAALVDAVRSRQPGEPVTAALQRVQLGQCKRFANPRFARFAKVIEDSPALQAKELEIMARYADALAGAIRESGVGELDAKIAANVLVGAHWQFFRNARKQAIAGKTGPAAERRMRKELQQAFGLLEGGLAQLEVR